MVTQVLFSIRENSLIAVDFFEEPLDKNLEVDRYWAYLLFHYDAMFAARKSNLDALSTHYNSAFSSLRTVLELIVRGAFYQCLCIPHQRKIILSMLNKDKKFKEFISRLEDSEISEALSKNSAGLYDKMEKYKIQGKDLPGFSTMLKCLEKTRLLQGIDNSFSDIRTLYHNVSDDVHVFPDNTDTGRTLLAGFDIFGDREIIPDVLKKYLKTMHGVMDLAMIVTMNTLKDNIRKSEKVKDKIRNHLAEDYIFPLNLRASKERLWDLTS